jgi:biotin carboxyl carrier protein
MPAPCLALLQSESFRETLSLAFRGVGQPARGPAQRFAAQAGPELRIGSGREKPAFTLRRDGEHRFSLRGPGLREALRAALDGPRVAREWGPDLLGALGQAPEALAFTACRLPGSAMALAVFGETLVLEDPLARLASPRADGDPASGPILAPMAGKILELHVAPGDPVEPGQLLFVLESMKMQFEIRSPRPGRIAKVLVAVGQILQGPEQLALLDATVPPTARGIPSTPGG